MSSGQRKRPGGAADSTPARKRSRLLPSSAGGTSQGEAIDLEQGDAPASEPEVIDLTGKEVIDQVKGGSSEVIHVSDDEAAVDREQGQPQPHLFSASENSAGPLARADEEEPREDDGAWPADPASPPSTEGGSSEVQDKEQSQQSPLGSRETENSAELGASDNEEEPGDNDDSLDSDEWPDRFESPPNSQDDITDDWEESLQYPFGSRSAENSPELVPSNLQQEPRDIEFEPQGGLVSPPDWEDGNAESQQYSLGSRGADNAAEVLENENEEEPQDVALTSRSLLCVVCMSCYTQLLQVHEQQRRNATLNSQEQVAGSGNGSGANDAPGAGPAPAGQGAEEDTQSSAAQAGVVRCPICMDVYSEIVESGRLILATMCGHVFCSECLPIALETAGRCPTCRMELTSDQYFPLYL